MDTLRARLDWAHDTHARAPADVAAALRAGEWPPAASPDEEAERIQLAEHVWLGHLGDGPALEEWLAAQAPAVSIGSPAAQAVDRARYALRCVALGGSEPALDGVDPGLPLPVRLRAQLNVLLCLDGQGRHAQVAARLEDLRAGTLPEAGDSAAAKAYAALANNLALHLRDAELRSPARDAVMLKAAAVARTAWAHAGTWLHVERAEYMLALCHAVACQPGPALQHARTCLNLCEVQGAEALECLFAHEAVVRAALCAGDADLAQRHRRAMQALLPLVDGAASRAWAVSTLAALPLRG